VLERINENAYKLELPADFRVSPTFNIADLKPYLGEEDELESRTTQIQEREDDEDIPIIGTTTPTTQQGPITQAQARQLNYQVKSFLAIQTSYSPNGVLLKPCDDFLMIRNLKAESDWRKNYSDNKQVEGGMRKRRIGPKNQTASSDSLFGPPRTSTGHNSPKGVGGS
jgi:hypothetical protein